MSALRARLERRLALLLDETRQRLSGSAAARSLDHADVIPLAAALERRMTAMVELLVAPSHRRAVLDRAELAARWGIGTADTGSLSEEQARSLRLLLETEQQADPPAYPYPLYWPSSVTPDEVADALERAGDPDAAQIAEALRRGWITPKRTSGGLGVRRELFAEREGFARAFLRWSLLDSARIVDLAGRVEADRRRPSMAVDAGDEHHALVAAMRDARDDGGGLRQWAAVLRLLSIDGARLGRVRWTLQRHLDALGASTRSREDPRFRARTAEAVGRLTRLELGVGPGRAVLTHTATYPPMPGSELALEGVELEIHPALYGGARHPSRVDLGGGWYPQTAELPRVDPIHHPHAVALGLLLPIRWRRDQAHARDHTRATGLELLGVAGIPFTPRRASEAWNKLRRDVAELQRISALGEVEWEGEPWTPEGVCILYPPQWARDRAVHDLPPLQPAVPDGPLTGRELVAWRGREGLSQAAAAQQLGVGVATLKRAEAGGDRPFGPALVKAFSRRPPP